jgi:uncharacterized protein YkwD
MATLTVSACLLLHFVFIFLHTSVVAQAAAAAAEAAVPLLAQCPAGYELACKKIAVVVTDTPSTFSNSDTGRLLLNSHNLVRARHRVPPLVWDSQLALAAAQWAARCTFGHSGAPGQGENLFASSAGTLASVADGALQSWYAEMRIYSFANPGYSPSTGHATQVLWKDSQRLGCAVQACLNGLNMGWGPDSSIVVCRYYPPGNVLYQFGGNVLPA